MYLTFFIFVEGGKTQRLLSATHGTGAVTTVAGTAGSIGYTGDGGLATSAKLYDPYGVAIDTTGNIYIADSDNHVIRKVDVDTNIITTVAGIGGSSGYSGVGGVATSALLNYPYGIAIDTTGNMYIADSDNHVIRMVNVDTNIITTVAGTAGSNGNIGDGGVATSALLNYPSGVALDTAGNIYIADVDNYVIRKVTKSTGIITTVAGTGIQGYTGDGGLATSALLNYPYGFAIDTTGNMYITDYFNQVVRKVTSSTGIITTVAGTGSPGYSGDGGPATSAELGGPIGVAVDVEGNIYITDIGDGAIRMVTSSTGIITTLATGVYASGIAVDIKGHVYTACRSVSIIRLIALRAPTSTPTLTPTNAPTYTPTVTPSNAPTYTPTVTPSNAPTYTPTVTPSNAPTSTPTSTPMNAPTSTPTSTPMNAPTYAPTSTPTVTPSNAPTYSPTLKPQLVFLTSAATPKTTPNLPAYLLISTFICFMGQLLFYSCW